MRSRSPPEDGLCNALGPECLDVPQGSSEGGVRRLGPGPHHGAAGGSRDGWSVSRDPAKRLLLATDLAQPALLLVVQGVCRIESAERRGEHDDYLGLDPDLDFASVAAPLASFAAHEGLETKPNGLRKKTRVNKGVQVTPRMHQYQFD